MSEAILEPTAKPFIPHITKENAAEYARRATASRMANAIAGHGQTPSAFVQHRLHRVRAQLARLDDMIEKEIDPQKIDRLVSAQTRLSEQWRILSGIPLPGSRRPGREAKSRPSSSSGPDGVE